MPLRLDVKQNCCKFYKEDTDVKVVCNAFGIDKYFKVLGGPDNNEMNKT